MKGKPVNLLRHLSRKVRVTISLLLILLLLIFISFFYEFANAFRIYDLEQMNIKLKNIEKIIEKKGTYLEPDTAYLVKISWFFYDHLMDKGYPQNYEIVNSMLYITNNIKKGITINNNIRSVYIMLEDPGAHNILVNGESRSKDDFLDLAWMGTCFAMKNNFHIEQRNLRLSYTRNIDVLSVYHKITSYGWTDDAESVSGYIVINYDKDSIDNQLNTILNQGEVFFLCNTETNETIQFGKTILAGNPDSYFNSSEFSNLRAGKISHIKQIADSSFNYILMNEDQRLKDFVDNTKYKILVFVLLIGILSAILFYNHYVQSEQIKLGEIELLYGHAQINSHFLLNTLDTIYWKTVYKNGIENKESALIEKLCSILKYSLDSSGKNTSLKDEIEYSKQYLELQKIRREIKMDVEWNIPEDIMNITTEKLIIQPILENCIQHALNAEGSETLLIQVNSQVENTELSLFIEDNGKGMKEDDLYRLNMLLQTNKPGRSSHIGLANINRRLKLQYGSNYGVFLKHSSLGGLCVELKLHINQTARTTQQK